MAIKHGLGRGLGALIQEVPVTTAGTAETGGIQRVAVSRITPNPWQPRRTFPTESLVELVHSIQERGVLQPLLVRPKGGQFELIAGERRLRAAQEAGLREVPVVVMEAEDHEALELALIENLQREDLNPLEEAEAYQVLAERFGLTQEQIAQRVHKARASVANALRLLTLPAAVRKLVADGVLSPGHAKVLLGVVPEAEQCRLAERVVKDGLSVRDLERLLERLKRGPRRSRGVRDDIPGGHLTHLLHRLHQHLGTSVRLIPCRTLPNGRKVKGSLQIDFYSNEELDRILQLLGLTEQP